MIPIYNAEIDVGIGDLVKADSSLAYTCPLVKLDDKLSLNQELLQAFAANNQIDNLDKVDLFPLYSVLVSTGWNKNLDVFAKEEVWAARNSPEDKPFNLNHKGLDIIGHITSNHVVDSDFNTVAEDTTIDNLPGKFHIITTAVIYKYWEDKERQKLIAQILDEITNSVPSKWAVSMEAIFRNFSYSLINSKGEEKIIERNETTASLTRHLRPYGGTGKYEDYQIGRVLRQITFAGKGLVRDPANPDSIISLFNLTNANLVYDNMLTEINKESVMADTALANIEKLITDLKTEFGTANLNRIHVLESQIDALKKGVDEHQTHITKHEAEKKALVDQHAGQMNTVTAELNQVKAKLEDMEKEKDMEKKDKDCVTAENEAMKKTLDEFKQASKKTSREKALRKTTIKAETIEKTLETFANLDDSVFDAMVTTFAMDDSDEDDKDESKADFGAHPVDGETPTTPATKTQDVNQFGPTNPKNVMGDPTHADVIVTASVEPNSNLGVLNEDKSIAKVQADIQKYLSKGKKVKGE